MHAHAFKPHAAKEYRGVVVCCIHSVGTATGGELLASRSGSFFTPGERPRCALGRRLCEPQSRSGCFVVWRNLLSQPVMALGFFSHQPVA